ncbi:hypothetical protein TCAL_14479 [Tigriopus californicus]|uniref:C2H2-type domain-containing protein n=1 Tax=Tigriopus californicus TaxID=6832 RepID=A0A553PTS8_TIGCA|nr:hypothetical protein TCAL_14479 [Tigriopus californicus]
MLVSQAEGKGGVAADLETMVTAVMEARASLLTQSTPVSVEEAGLDENLGLGSGEHEEFHMEMPQMELRGDPMVGILKLDPHHSDVIQEETITLGHVGGKDPEVGGLSDDTREINFSDISYVTMDDNGDTVIIVNTDQVLSSDPSGPISVDGYTLSSEHLLGNHIMTSGPPASTHSTPTPKVSRASPLSSLVLSQNPPQLPNVPLPQLPPSPPLPHTEAGGRADYTKLRPGDKIFTCVVTDCPYFCHWQGDMIVHLISAHSAQVPVDRIVPVILDGVEHGEGKCSYCVQVCFSVTTIVYGQGQDKRTYRQCKLCGFASTGGIFNHIPQCHQPNVIISEPMPVLPSFPTAPLPSQQQPVTVAVPTPPINMPVTRSLSPLNFPRKIMEVTTVNNRPTYKLPFIDLVSSVKSGRLETPSERNKRKRRKTPYTLKPHPPAPPPPGVGNAPLAQLRTTMGGITKVLPTVLARASQSSSVAPPQEPSADSEEDTSNVLKKPPNLHITRQTVANFVCRTCGKVQKDNQALIQHMSIDHRHDKKFKCSKCTFQTDSVMAWNNHYLDCTIQPDYKLERILKGENGDYSD